MRYDSGQTDGWGGITQNLPHNGNSCWKATAQSAPCPGLGHILPKVCFQPFRASVPFCSYYGTFNKRSISSFTEFQLCSQIPLKLRNSGYCEYFLCRKKRVCNQRVAKMKRNPAQIFENEISMPFYSLTHYYTKLKRRQAQLRTSVFWSFWKNTGFLLTLI